MISEDKIPTNTPLGRPIATGRTAEIYPWQDGQILKLFHDWFDLESIKFEQQIGRAVHTSDLPVPFVGEIIKINGHYGLIYQFVDGSSMLATLQAKPWLVFSLARRQAVLQAQMHQSVVEISLPNQRQAMEYKIRHAGSLSVQHRSAMLAQLKSLPGGDRICHGDLHPGNILLTAHGQIIIDWTDATLGNPLADVARSSILLLGAAASDQIPNLFQKLIIRLFQSVAMRHYFYLCPGGVEEYHRWLPVVAAARLSENIPELESWLVRQSQLVLRN